MIRATQQTEEEKPFNMEIRGEFLNAFNRVKQAHL
jgi:hypothetical protein